MTSSMVPELRVYQDKEFKNLSAHVSDYKHTKYTNVGISIPAAGTVLTNGMGPCEKAYILNL